MEISGKENITLLSETEIYKREIQLEQMKKGRPIRIKGKYSFDRVFSDGSAQEEVYLEVQPLVTSFLDGFNVCIAAYGQTGTGKTYTMQGQGVQDIGYKINGKKDQCQQQSSYKPPFSKLSLVDLAGSESADKSGAEGKHRQEASKINQSLSTLGTVLERVKTSMNPIPYRESKLTNILQDSLGAGDSKLTLIVCISPNKTNYTETAFALEFAAKAAKTKVNPTTNQNRKIHVHERYISYFEQFIALTDFWITKSEFSAGQCQPYIHALILFTYENGHPAKTYEDATIKKELPKRDAELWLPLPNDPNTFQIYVHLFAQCELED
ncbi:MAG: putative Kinesin heavy chain [Streblomastix strix]|uniref:Kinesin-like protein n=1 Tax=Streblomastix strix TaxID=222440 RepID=A0A5J4V359_9EUKA|nr:MAG: putative Kinesin heavy chain [Streblomastix strix]